MILLTTLNSQYIHTSLALYTLQAYCRREFPEIRVAEFNINQNLSFILGAIYRQQPKVLGISTNIWNITPSLELVEQVKKVLPQTVVILGGPEASADYGGILARPDAPDYIICGEGEATLRELLTKLQKGETDLSTVEGLAFRQGEVIRRTPDRAPLNLETIPFPYPELAPFRDRILYYEASRGCPFQCAYCMSGWEKAALRTLSLDRVKTDLLQFVAAGVRIVKLIDRTFNVDRERTKVLIRYLLEKGGATEFHFELVGELLDDEMIALLKAAPRGRFRVEIGVQSTCVAALQAVHRRYDLARLEKNCLALTAGASGPTVHLDLIAGLPYEDLATFGHSFDWTFHLHPDELQLGFLKLLKGSPLRDQAVEYGYAFTSTPPYEILRSKWLSYADLLHLKAVEEMVDKFFNSKHFRYTLAYLFWEDTLSPWAFFSGLARFWQDQGYSGQAHKQVLLYDRLWRFLTTAFLVGGEEQPKKQRQRQEENLRALLTLDYYLSGTGGQSPSWLIPQTQVLREKVKTILKNPDQTDLVFPSELPLSEVRRRMVVLELGIDPETLVEGGCPVFIYLPAQGYPSWYRLPATLLPEDVGMTTIDDQSGGEDYH